MKYYGSNKVGSSYRKLAMIIRPVANICIYSLLILCFCILSYKLILGDGKPSVPSMAAASTAVTEDSIKGFTVSESTVVPEEIKIDSVKVYVSSKDKVEELPLEEYIKGVVSSEMPLNFNKEALKAQAIAARTYTVAHVLSGSGCSNSPGADLCDSVHCQVYTPKDVKMAQLGGMAEARWSLVEEVVEETRGMVISYGGKVIEGAFYFSTSSGKTENVEDVFSKELPYLKSVDSEGEEVAPRYSESKNVDLNRFVTVINSNYPDAGLSPSNLQGQISIQSYTDGGCVKEIKVGNVTITGVKFRKLFGLNSANFNLEFLSNEVVISCRGFGHGVGMSQWGANIMAGNGSTCEEIIKHYYTGVDITKINEE